MSLAIPDNLAGINPRSSAAPTNAAGGPYSVRIQVPTDIGERPFGDPEHVHEPFRPAEIRHQGNETAADADHRAQPARAAQRRQPVRSGGGGPADQGRQGITLGRFRENPLQSEHLGLNNSAVSGSVNPRSWARISPGSPLPRHRCSRTAGSTRVGNTGRTGGR